VTVLEEEEEEEEAAAAVEVEVEAERPSAEEVAATRHSPLIT
jgi:hypothetical protein